VDAVSGTMVVDVPAVLRAVGEGATFRQIPGKRLLTLMHAFEDEGITAKTAFLEEEDFVRGVRASTQVLRQIFFRPNTLFFNLTENALPELQELIDKTAAYQMAIILLARHAVMNMGRMVALLDTRKTTREEVLSYAIGQSSPDIPCPEREKSL